MKHFLVSIMGLILIAALLAGCTAGTASSSLGGTARADTNSRFEKLYTIKIGEDPYEFYSAQRRLTWQSNAGHALTLTISPISVSQIGQTSGTAKDKQTSKTRTFSFKDRVLFWDGTNADGEWISGTTPSGLETTWESGNYQYEMQSDIYPGSSGPYSEKTKRELSEAALRLEKNAYDAPDGYTLTSERWRLELYYHDIQMDIAFFPQPLDNQVLREFTGGNAAVMRANGITYLRIEDIREDSCSRMLIWQTDHGLFWMRGIFAASPEQADDQKKLSIIDFELAVSISNQLDVQMVPLPEGDTHATSGTSAATVMPDAIWHDYLVELVQI
jgi:hypothetical protein